MIYNKLWEIEEKVAKLEKRLGLPQRRDLMIRKALYNNQTNDIEITDILIEPTPHITFIKPQYLNLQISVEGADSIFISKNDLQVEIPRTVPKETFLTTEEETLKIRPDPPLNELREIDYIDEFKNIEGSNWYRMIFLDESDPVVWTLILTKDYD